MKPTLESIPTMDFVSFRIAADEKESSTEAEIVRLQQVLHTLVMQHEQDMELAENWLSEHAPHNVDLCSPIQRK